MKSRLLRNLTRRADMVSLCLRVLCAIEVIVVAWPLPGSGAGSAPVAKHRSNRAAEALVGTYPIGPCDASDVLNLTASAGPLHNASRHAIALLAARIRECESIIANYVKQLPSSAPVVVASVDPALNLPNLPSPSPRPTSPPQCGGYNEVYDVVRTYAALLSCQQWIARYISSPTPATPQPLVFHTPSAESASAIWEKHVYVLSLASDAPTSAQVVYHVAQEFGNLSSRVGDHDRYIPKRSVTYKVLAEPLWTVSTYQQQCLNDSSTAGAVVLLPPSTQSGTWNLLLSASWTSVGMQAIVLDCEPTNTSLVNNQSYITWISAVDTGTGRRYSFSLATALSLLQGYQVFHPLTTYSYSVAPPSPSPAPGASYKTGYSTTNGQVSNYIGAAGVAALTPLSQTSLGQGAPTTDSQIAEAIRQGVPVLFREMKAFCASAEGAAPVAPSLTETQCQWFKF
jgi:hypothetical protein